MGADEKVIFVYSDQTEGSPELMGTLYAGNARGKELVSFAYDKRWLSEGSRRHILDPDLYLFEGRQYAPQGKTLFGIFTDSCPDRWGRLLLSRKEAILARADGRKPRALTETDYLLGVLDKTRMGALRFSLSDNGPFLAQGDSFSVPPWASLRSLEAASRQFENDDAGFDDTWLNMLLAPGSSLGGARPKASVLAPDGSLWIAKFPSKYDEWNSGAWEMVVHDLAVKCGLNVPEAKLEFFSGTGGTFLVKRFDRNGNLRVHFSSAMTLLGRTDGDADDASYLDLAAFIRANGAEPERDLLELWKRIVFNIAVSNTDDHLRNHGFLLADKGWELSPLYDVNPNVFGDTLSLNINADDNLASFELALETARYYGIEARRAEKTISDIKGTIQKLWHKLASDYGLSRSAADYMEPAFSAALG